jgi:hypothetical protein
MSTIERNMWDDGVVLCGDVMHRRADGSVSRRLCGGCSALVDVIDADDRIVGSRMANPDGCRDVLERSADVAGDGSSAPADESSRERHVLQLCLRDLECAAHAWAAAASTSRAMAPALIARALVATGGDLMRAALEGTAAALAEHELDVAGGWSGPAPRGLDLHVRGGAVTSIDWASDTHAISLARRGAGGWRLTIASQHPLSESDRVRAALVVAWRQREPEDYAAIAAAAQEAGLDDASLDAAARTLTPEMI